MLDEPGLQEETVQSMFKCLSGNYEYSSLEEKRLAIYEKTWIAAQIKVEEGHNFRLDLLRELMQMYTEAGRYKDAEEILLILVADQETLPGIVHDDGSVGAQEDPSIKQLDGDDGTSIIKKPEILPDVQTASPDELVAAVVEQIEKHEQTGPNHGSEDDKAGKEDSPEGDEEEQAKSLGGIESTAYDDSNYDRDGQQQRYIQDLESLARLMQTRCAFQEAEAVYRKILKKKLQFDSSSDRSTLQTILDLQYVCEKQEKADAAEDHQRRYIEASEQWDQNWRDTYRRTYWDIYRTASEV